MKSVLILVCLFSLSARADLDQMYGFGSTTAAQAGANRARSYDAFTVLLNPALMSYSEGTHFTTGLIGTVDYFQDINNVVIDNEFIGGTGTRTGNVETDVPDTFNVLLGAVWALSSDERAWRLGVGLGFPGDKVMEPNTKDIYQPQYAMYLSDTQRFAANVALSRKLSEKISIGAGGSYHLMTGATVQARLPSDGGAANPKTSTSNLKMIVKPTLSPLLGLAFSLSEDHQISLNYKGARDARVATRFDSMIELVGVAPIIFSADGSIFYDPETLTLATSRRLGKLDLNFAIDHEKWSNFDGAIVKFKFDTFTNSFKQYRYNTRYHDIWVPRVGFSLATSDTSYFRFGYAFKPSPTPALDDETNFLDSDRHILGLGYDFQSLIFGLLDAPVKLATHMQAHYLNPKDVKKSSATDIGAPGYQIKGYVLSYGLTMTVDL